MAKDFIGYQALTDAALRSVVREALRRVEKQGLIGTHHFFLTFKTKFPGLEIPDFLHEQYPDEMTIILQHQFSGLRVKENHFEVTLTFRKLPATLVIPYEALTAFFDPGVQFGLQFRGAEGDAKPGVAPKMPTPVPNRTANKGGELPARRRDRKEPRPARSSASTFFPQEIATQPLFW